MNERNQPHPNSKKQKKPKSGNQNNKNKNNKNKKSNQNKQQSRRDNWSDDPDFTKKVRVAYALIRSAHHLDNLSKPETPQFLQKWEKQLANDVKPAHMTDETRQLLARNAKNWTHNTALILRDHYATSIETQLDKVETMSTLEWTDPLKTATGWARRNLGKRLRDETLEKAEVLFATKISRLQAPRARTGATSSQRAPSQRPSTPPPPQTLDPTHPDWSPLVHDVIPPTPPPRPQRSQRPQRRLTVQAQIHTGPTDSLPPGQVPREDDPEPELENEEDGAQAVDLASPLGSQQANSPAADLLLGLDDPEDDLNPDRDLIPLIPELLEPTVAPQRAAPAKASTPTFLRSMVQQRLALDNSRNSLLVFETGSPTPPSPSAPVCFPNKHQNTSRKLKDWSIHVAKKWLVIGDSNVSRMPPCNLRDLQIESYPGATFKHVESILAHGLLSCQPEKVVLSLGINSRSQCPQQTTVKQIQSALRAASNKFPRATVYIPILNFSGALPTRETNNLIKVNEYLQKNHVTVPRLPSSEFKTMDDKVHWTRDTAKAMLLHWGKQLNCISPQA